MKRCLVNGLDKHLLNVSDRGLQYGDDLFETIAVRAGRPRNWQLHMQRLGDGCQRLGMSMPDIELLSDEIARVSLDMPEAVVKIILTRGADGRGYRYNPSTAKGNRIVASHDWPEYPLHYYQQGVRLKVCSTRVCNQPALAGIKHLNRLENVLARNEWHDDSFAEGLMLDASGQVIEGTMSNLFWAENGELYTPALDNAGVRGVMRQRVFDTCAELGVHCHEAATDIERLHAADELFVCNSIIGIWPATLAETSVRGLVTTRLMQRLAETDGILFI